MTIERQGEIALLYMKNKLKKDGKTICPNSIRREAIATAQELGIPVWDGLEFADIMLDFLFSQATSALGKKKFQVEPETPKRLGKPVVLPVSEHPLR